MGEVTANKVTPSTFRLVKPEGPRIGLWLLKGPSIDRFPKLAVPNEGLSPEAAFVTKDEVCNVHLEVLTWRGSLGSYISLTPP